MREKKFKTIYCPVLFFLTAYIQPSGKRTISSNSPGSCLATGRTSVGHDLTIRNSEERMRQKVILPSMIPVKQQGKCCSENIRAYKFSARTMFRYKLHIPGWCYALDHPAQYKEYRLLLLYYVIVNYLRLHVKLNFNDLLSFCLEGLSWKPGVLSFWWVFHSKNITHPNNIVKSVVTQFLRKKLNRLLACGEL